MKDTAATAPRSVANNGHLSIWLLSHAVALVERVQEYANEPRHVIALVTFRGGTAFGNNGMSRINFGFAARKCK